MTRTFRPVQAAPTEPPNLVMGVSRTSDHQLAPRLQFHKMSQGRTPNDAGTGTTQTQNREAMIQDAVTIAVETALKPVTSSLGDIQEQLGPVTDHLEENTVAAHGQMLQDCLGPLQDILTAVQPEILNEMGQRFARLDSNVETLQNQTKTANQHLDDLGQSVQVTLGVAAATGKRVGDITNDQQVTNRHVNDLVIDSRQIYNFGCGPGFVRQFKTIPFIRTDGEIQSPNDLGLPSLWDIRVINNLTDHQLDQYLEGYGIEHNGLDREAKLSKLAGHIGCAPIDRSSSHSMTLYFMLIMGCLLYLYFPQLFA